MTCSFIVNLIVKKFAQQNRNTKNANALILGATFKENCPDLHSSVDLHRELGDFGFVVDVHDPQADSSFSNNNTGIEEIDKKYDQLSLRSAY